MFKIFKNIFNKNISQETTDNTIETTVSDDMRQLAEEYCKLGNEYFDKDDFDSALAKYNKAIQLNPYVSNYYNDRGLIYYYKEKDEEAKKDLCKAIELDKRNYCSYYNLGRLYRDGFKNYNTAINYFNTAITIKADNPNYYYELAETYFKNNNAEKALENYLKILELDSDFKHKDKIILKTCFIQMIIARSEHSIKSWFIAKDVVKNISLYIDKHQDDPRGYKIRGNAMHLLVENNKAIEDLLQSIKLDDENVNEDTYWYLGHCYWREEKFKDAIKYFDKLIDMNDRDSRYFLFRGISYFHIKKADNALSDLNKTLEMVPDDSLAYLYLGYIYEDIAAYNIAIEKYNKAIEYDLGNMEHIAYYHLGIIYCDGLHKYNLAVSAFDKAIELCPNKYLYYSFAGYAYTHKGMQDQTDNLQLALTDYERAIELYRKAYELDTGESRDYDATVGYAINLRDKLLTIIDNDNNSNNKNIKFDNNIYDKFENNLYEDYLQAGQEYDDELENDWQEDYLQEDQEYDTEFEDEWYEDYLQEQQEYDEAFEQGYNDGYYIGKCLVCGEPIDDEYIEHNITDAYGYDEGYEIGFSFGKNDEDIEFSNNNKKYDNNDFDSGDDNEPDDDEIMMHFMNID